MACKRHLKDALLELTHTDPVHMEEGRPTKRGREGRGMEGKGKWRLEVKINEFLYGIPGCMQRRDPIVRLLKQKQKYFSKKKMKISE